MELSVLTNLGDLEDDRLGALAGGGDVDVHVSVLLLHLYRRPVALGISDDAVTTDQCDM